MDEEEIEEALRQADGLLAAAGHVVDNSQADDDVRAALRGEITFDEVVERAARRTREA